MVEDLDSLVKGAPPNPGQAAELVRASSSLSPTSTSISTSTSPGPGADPGSGPIASSTPAKAGDPLHHTPSSPSMIYLNLLVLEASLRAQYLELRARRRHHSFFLALLTAWVAGFAYALFLAPREDGRGVGGSVYWVVEVAEKVALMGGLATALLVWATGIWDRGVRWPRRWFGVANRGLRPFNAKLVLLRRPWWAEALASTGWFLTYGLLSQHTSAGSSYRYVEPHILRDVDRDLGGLSAAGHPTLPVLSEEGGGGGGSNNNSDAEKAPGQHGQHHHHPLRHSPAHAGGREEDLAPGGDYVKLLLLAKPFSPTFRENWELYRTEYWDRENERRALLRARLQVRDKALRRQTGGWLWWLRPWRRVGAAPDPTTSSSISSSSNGTMATTSTTTGERWLFSQQQNSQNQNQQQQQQLQQPGGGSDLAADKAGGSPHHARHGAVAASEHRRTRSGSSLGRRGSGSAGSSRSTTPTVELEEGGSGGGNVSRKASTASNASDKLRRKSSKLAGGGGGSQRQGAKRTHADSRSVTPDMPSPLAKESSFSSAASSDSGVSSGGRTVRQG